MAEYSDIDDLSLCQVLEMSTSVLERSTSQPQAAADHLDQSAAENASAANLSDVGAGVSRTYSSEIAVGAKCNGVTGCDMDSDDSEELISVAETCCDGDILFGDAVQDPACDSNGMITENDVEENPPLSISECSPDRNEAAEPVADGSLSPRLENAVADSSASKELKTPDEEEGGANLSDENLATAERSTDSIEPQACDGADDRGSASSSAEEFPSNSGGNPAEDRKPLVLSFSSDVLLVAATGKAANVLGRRTGLQAFTLHQVIFSYRAWRQSDFRSQVGWKFDSVRALVVDESSLVAVTTFYSLISKVLPSLQKVVLLGDILQLPSILPGRPYTSASLA